jgi:hypothetical protein
MAPDRVQTWSNIATDRLRQECQWAKLAARAGNRKNAVLELDETTEMLCVWYWCISQLKYKITSKILPFFWSRPVNDDGECVVPSDLAAHRRSYQFQGPQCLCAFIDDNDDDNTSNHHEAAIITLTWGPHIGEYVACCVISKCGYVGRLPLAIFFI